MSYGVGEKNAGVRDRGESKLMGEGEQKEKMLAVLIALSKEDEKISVFLIPLFFSPLLFFC